MSHQNQHTNQDTNQHKKQDKKQDKKQVLIIAHSRDRGGPALVEKAVWELGGIPVRFESDLFPTRDRLSLQQDQTGDQFTLTTPEGTIRLDQLSGVWLRRMGTTQLPADLDREMARVCHMESTLALTDLLCALPPEVRHINSWAVREGVATYKQLQQTVARRVGLAISPTLITNRPDDVRAFMQEHGRIITKMQTPIPIQDAENPKVKWVLYTNEVTKNDLEDTDGSSALDGLAYCPMMFQKLIEKRCDLRAVVVGDQVFTAALLSQKYAESQLDCRKDVRRDVRKDISQDTNQHSNQHSNQQNSDTCDVEPYTLPAEIAEKVIAVCRELGLVYAGVDLILTKDGEYVFLEANPSGEFAWVEEYAQLPISKAIAAYLLGQTPAMPPPRIVNQPVSVSTDNTQNTQNTQKQILIVTRSDDMDVPDDIATEIRALGHMPIRFDLDRFPTHAGLSVYMGAQEGHDRWKLSIDGVETDLLGLAALYIRKLSGPALPPQLDRRFAATCYEESRTTTIGLLQSLALPCLGIRYVNTHGKNNAAESHKIYQQSNARAAGLPIVPTLLSNDPQAVQSFAQVCANKSADLITKMQAQFSIGMDQHGRGGQVVMTNTLKSDDLQEDVLAGLSLCPMLFQEKIKKTHDIRVVVVGEQTFAAHYAVSQPVSQPVSTQQDSNETDWRRHAHSEILAWQATTLPADLSRMVVDTCRRLGLQYGAADLVRDQQGQYHFLEVNPAGEYLWVERVCQHPISKTIAAYLCC